MEVSAAKILRTMRVDAGADMAMVTDRGMATGGGAAGIEVQK